ncbi:MAG: hypothetical protein LBT10_09985 [Methanobrevibacter sp.]|jgi:hypothetical protein|nr:hypothetical protein [Methanobrevibacter sp.]
MTNEEKEKIENTSDEETTGNPEPKKNQRNATDEVRKKFPQIGEMDF